MAALASSLVVAGCGTREERARNPALVQVDAGPLRGIATRDTLTFRGIPYAAPPVGSRRFAPPAPVEPWKGVRDASRFAAKCPQEQATDEDCLHLNIVAPRNAGGGKLPVMVWLHGGGFSGGTANSYDASELAARGKVVVVAVEFRVNVFGLLALPGMAGAGNLIFLDQQAALRWVKRNIAAFGGDPGNVTLFGESGGAIGTCAHLVSPGSRGLFHKAILQSGSCSTSFAADFVARGVPAGNYFEPLARMETQGVTLAKALGCPGPDGAAMLACLRRAPAAVVTKAGAALISASYGTATLPQEPAAALTADIAVRVPVLTGFNEQEGLALVAGMQLVGAPVTASDYPELVRGAFRVRSGDVLAHYPLASFGGRGDLAWAAVITDRMFACPQLRDAAEMARGTPVYTYEFADPDGAGLIPTPPGLPRGPSHSSELPLIFRLADAPVDIATGRRIERSAEQRRLSAHMITAWTSFAGAGSPVDPDGRAWPRFDRRGTAFTWLGTARSPRPARTAAERHECEFWSGMR